MEICDACHGFMGFNPWINAFVCPHCGAQKKYKPLAKTRILSISTLSPKTVTVLNDDKKNSLKHKEATI